MYLRLESFIEFYLLKNLSIVASRRYSPLTPHRLYYCTITKQQWQPCHQDEMRATRGIALLTSSFTRASRYSSGLAHLSRANDRLKMSTPSEGNNQGAGNLLRTHLDRLRSSPSETLLLDGGTGEELFLHGVPDDRKIWSANAIVNKQYHSIVEDVHRSFIDAGSQAITTNSYGITPGVGFADGEEVKRLVAISAEIARKAAGKSVLVLGSLGPQVESYRPDLIMKHDDGVNAYLNTVEGLYPHIDIFLAETMSCLEEACQAIAAVSKFHCTLSATDVKHPMMVSFTLGSDGKTRNEESVAEVIPKLVEYAHKKRVECEFCMLYFRQKCCRNVDIM